ncbi:MAG TPA: hypothetical protein VFV63_20870 [Ilumatobacteraceae bacterium]|nr:hypothetical protein [Ilumatobacteraceae bacterium]
MTVLSMPMVGSSGLLILRAAVGVDAIAVRQGAGRIDVALSEERVAVGREAVVEHGGLVDDEAGAALGDIDLDDAVTTAAVGGRGQYTAGRGRGRGDQHCGGQDRFPLTL